AATSEALFWSAAASTGLTMAQPFGPFFKSVTSPDAALISSWLIFDASNEKIFCFAFLSATGFFASMKYRYAPNPRATTSRMRVEPNRRMLPPLEPGIEAGPEHETGNQQQRHPREPPLLIARQRDAAVVFRARMDGDEIFLLCEPVVDIDEQIRVALDADDGIRGEIRIADHCDARLRFARRAACSAGRRCRIFGIFAEREPDRDRALVVARFLVERHFAAGRKRFQIRFGPASLAGLQEVLHRLVRVRARLAADRLRERERGNRI